MKFACRSTPNSPVSSPGAAPDRLPGRGCIASMPGRMSIRSRLTPTCPVATALAALYLGPRREAQECSPTWTNGLRSAVAPSSTAWASAAARREYGIHYKTKRVRNGLGGGLRPDAGQEPQRPAAVLTFTVPGRRLRPASDAPLSRSRRIDRINFGSIDFGFVGPMQARPG